MKKNCCDNWLTLKKLWATKTFLSMRLTFYVLLLATIQSLAVDSYAQATKLNLTLNNTTVKQVLSEIEDVSEFYFLYNSKLIDVERKVDVKFKNKKIDEALDLLFKDTQVSYNIVDRQIVLSGNQSIKTNSLSVQQKSIIGTITDEGGLPLPGVTVVIKGTTVGTVTNMDGNYNISNIPDNATLVFSFVGMLTQEIAISDQTSINITMAVDAIGIEEVVAIGYGTARRIDISGSVKTVKMEDSPLAITPNFNALSALKGVTTGLNIGTVNTAGGNPSLLIRGQNSISGSNNPLIVLDGTVYLGSIGDINPNDIASYDILKDASSTSVYGSRAANGVIIITTKKGKTAKPVIRLNTSTSINVWQQKPDLESPEQYLQRMEDRFGMAPLSIPHIKNYERANIQAGKSTDWLSLASRVGLNQNHNLSVSGGNNKMNYYLSSGYIKQEGVMIGDDFEQASLKAKLSSDITDWLKVTVDGSYSFRDASGLGASLGAILQTPPYGQLYFDEDNKILEKYPRDESIVNGLWNTDKTRVEDVNLLNYYRFNGKIQIDVPFVKGLRYTLNYARGSRLQNLERFYNESYYVSERSASEGDQDLRYTEEQLLGRLPSANGYMVRGNNYNYVIDNIINYKKQFDSHYLDITLVATRDYSKNKNIRIDGSNFAANGNTLLGVNGLHKAEVQRYDINIVEESNIGYLSRVGYSYKDKYHLTASLRRDGSSVFGSDKKWGNFPSAGIAWTASKEKFLKSSKNIDYLKLKLSYGKNGNQGINAYNTLTQVNSGKDGGIRYEFGNDPSKVLYGMAVSSLGNPALGWETTTSLNGGIETALLNSRVFLNADFYFSETTDQLFVRNIPIMSGFSSIRSSLGQVNNRGIEIELTTVNIKNNNLTWKSSLIFWQNRNVLEKLYGDDFDNDGIEDDDIGNSLFIGKSLGAIYGYESDGIVQEDDTEYINNTGAKPGDVKFVDVSGPDGGPDGIINATYDRKILGYTKENFRLNLANTVNIKDFELYVLLSGIFGGGKDNYYTLSNKSAFSKSQYEDRTELNTPYWTPENKNESYPSPSSFDNRYVGIQSRTFVRIQDVTLSYRFNQPWVKKWNIMSLKLYAAIQNLYTFTGWVGGDPEQGSRALSGTYPVPTVYSLGLDINF